MVKPTTLFTASAGLNTRLDPQRLMAGHDNEAGISEFAQAVNVSIDDRGMVELRRGSTIASPGEFHSLFRDGGDCFAVKEEAGSASLVRVNADLSTSVIRSDLTKNLKMEWGQANTDTFYSNRMQHGYIRSGVSSSWPVGTYQGPDADIEFAVSVPAPSHFAFFQNFNKCALAVGNYIIINHLPFQYGLYAPALGTIGFESDVLMLFGVEDGFYASDCRYIWFFRRLTSGWYDYRQERVCDYPALEWSLAHDKVRLRDAGMDADGFGRVFATPEGVCLAMNGGSIVNLTKEKIKYPSGYGSGACLVRDTTIIHTAS